jgi:hypothetical protein
LEEKGLEDFLKSFTLPEYRVYLAYYEDLDEYHVEADGNHRITWAKIVGASVILADVSIYRLSHIKHRNYMRVQRAKQKWVKLLQKCKLEWQEKSNMVQYHGTPLFRHVEPSVEYEKEFSYQNHFEILCQASLDSSTNSSYPSSEMDQKPKMESYMDSICWNICRKETEL